MGNVKHITSNGEKLVTSCKKLSTALKRFTAFLNDYDSYYNKMLSEIDSDHNCVILDIDVADGFETIVMTLEFDGFVYTLTIKHSFERKEQTDNKDTDNKDTDNKDTDNNTDNKDTDNTSKIHHMKCEYFISSSPNSKLDCIHCIYYDYGACPADMEHYKLICDD